MARSVKSKIIMRTRDGSLCSMDDHEALELRNVHNKFSKVSKNKETFAISHTVLLFKWFHSRILNFTMMNSILGKSSLVNCQNLLMLLGLKGVSTYRLVNQPVPRQKFRWWPKLRKLSCYHLEYR